MTIHHFPKCIGYYRSQVQKIHGISPAFSIYNSYGAGKIVGILIRNTGYCNVIDINVIIVVVAVIPEADAEIGVIISSCRKYR
jgi:hypothetical protein